MSPARTIRLGLAIVVCLGALVLTLVWKTVPAVLEPCSWEDSGGIEEPYSLGTCLRGPSTAELALKLAVALLSITAVAVIVARVTLRRKVVAGAAAAALSALVGLTTLQAISGQVFEVSYVPPVEAIATVGIAFFLYGGLVGWGTQRWWPNRSLERTR